MQFTSSALGAVIGCQKCGATTLKLVDSAVKNYIFGSGYICSEVHNGSNVPNKTTDNTWLSDFTINDFYYSII